MFCLKDLNYLPYRQKSVPSKKARNTPSYAKVGQVTRNFTKSCPFEGTEITQQSVAVSSGPSSPELVIPPPTITSTTVSSPVTLFTAKSFSPAEYIQNELKKWNPETPITHAKTPPSTWYVDPLFLKAEAMSVFNKNWLCVGRLDSLKEVGSYISGSILGEPYIVVRSSTGELKAFFNICRHHAARILQNGEGKLDSCELVCPYHGWTYTLEGNLRKATQIKGIKDFKASEYGLKTMKVNTFGPWVFIKIDNSAVGWELDKELSPLEEALSKTDYKDLKWVASTNYTVNCNWKIFVDNYCDGGYHVPYLHKGLNSQIDMKTYETKIFNKFSLQIAHSKPTDDPMLQKRIGDVGAHYAYIYPNFMINRYGDAMDTNLVIPLSADKTLVRFDYFFKTTTGTEYEDFIKQSVKISDQVQGEDDYISEMVQEGLSSSGFDVGRYAPNVETAAYHFHQLLWKDLHSNL